jgi:hypothetical protein
MPGGDRYPGPPEALAAYRDAIADFGQTEVKGAKSPYTSRNGHMFSFLAPDGTMALRLSDERGAAFLDRYESGPVEQYGRTMRGYVSVPQDLLQDTEELAAWLADSWSWIGTLAPK